VAERRPQSLHGDAGETSRVVRLARPSGRTLPPAANDNPPRFRLVAVLLPLLVALAALALLLAGAAG
jgi:hypothetical protein